MELIDYQIIHIYLTTATVCKKLFFITCINKKLVLFLQKKQ